jgi:hypothetical protein
VNFVLNPTQPMPTVLTPCLSISVLHENMICDKNTSKPIGSIINKITTGFLKVKLNLTEL